MQGGIGFNLPFQKALKMTLDNPVHGGGVLPYGRLCAYGDTVFMHHEGHMVCGRASQVRCTFTLTNILLQAPYLHMQTTLGSNDDHLGLGSKKFYL